MAAPTRSTAAPSGFKHLDTPTKSRIRGVKEFVDFIEENDLTAREGSSLRNLVKCFGPNTISKSSVSRALASTSDRRKTGEERRGRPAKSEEEKKKEALEARLLESNNGEVEEPQDVSYDSLRQELQIPDHISDAKISRALNRHFGNARDGRGRFRSLRTPVRPKKDRRKSTENQSNTPLPNPTGAPSAPFESQPQPQPQPQPMFHDIQFQGTGQNAVGNNWDQGMMY